ncbi:rodlin [Streptomyces sp. NPDC017936]|uniref:rodlin n=1 Tax=Streptomyces sp. NPDC017936 TaxID=3365016 RepID=UPI0037956B72
MKKRWATGAVAVSTLAGFAFASTPQALAVGDRTTSAGGDGDGSKLGDPAASGDRGPRLSLVRKALGKPCVGPPARMSAGSLVGVVPVPAPEAGVLPAPRDRRCAGDSPRAGGVESLSPVLDDVPLPPSASADG